MEDLSTKPASPPGPSSVREPATESIYELQQLSPLSRALHWISSACSADWEAISEQRGFYDEKDSLRPSHILSNRKLQDRGSDEVVIFDYSLAPGSLGGVGGNPTIEGGGIPSEGSSADDDVFIRVPKKKLIHSKQFNEITNPTKELRLIPSRGARLHIM